MSSFLALAWRVALTLVLVGVVLGSLRVRAPRERVPKRDLRRLVASGGLLYLVGTIAALDHRAVLAAVSFGAGILICSLAVWLSRGGSEPGGGWDDGQEPPIDPDPGPGPEWDWDDFERELADYASGARA